MKYLYHILVAFCMLMAATRLNSQPRTFDHGVNDGEPNPLSTKEQLSSYYSFDWGLGWMADGESFFEHEGPSDGGKCILVSSKYLDRSIESVESVEAEKHEMNIHSKIADPLFDIIGLHVDEKSNGYLIRIHCTKELPDFESWLKPIGGDTWLYVTLADAKADVGVLQDFEPTAFVKRFLIFQTATSVQLTFLLNGQVNNVELIPVGDSQDVLVVVFTPTEEDLAIRKSQ